jgi:hypothetical protein
MGRHAENSEVAEAGAAALWALGGGSDASRSVAVAEGAVPALSAAMSAHQGSLALQVVACAALRHFAASPGAAAAVAATGGMEALVSALRLHGNSAALQEAGCDALAALAQGGGIELQRVALEAGGLEVCKAALTTRFPSHAGVQRAARTALETLTVARLSALDGGADEAGDGSASSLGPAPARSSCQGALQGEYLSGLQARLVSWLGGEGGNSDWFDLVELALTSSWQELESGLSTTSIAPPAVSRREA